MSGMPGRWYRDRNDTCVNSQLFSRISGDAALDKDILGSVSEQIQKNFARTHWKVSKERVITMLLFQGVATDVLMLVLELILLLDPAWPDPTLFPQRAFNATSFLHHIRKLGQSPEGEEVSRQGRTCHSHPGLGTSQSPKW